MSEAESTQPKEESQPESMKAFSEPEKKPVIGTKINKIVMHGFKSFANRTELLFGDKFNTVLGPNGSGKSNIIDAVCFVLGKSSSKALRAEKASNLLYNGGKTKSTSKQAEVSIYFDNTNKTFPMEEDEIKITRLVKGDGQSTYKINGQTRTRQQVVDLLSVAKINPDGYNIILQGDIVRFVEMSPIERRQIIEEIAGISIYEEKKAKALNELEKVEQRLKEAEIILNEREAYLKDLKKDRDQAVKYKDLNDRINTNRASYLKIQIDRKEHEKSKYDKLIFENQKKIDAIKETINKTKEEIAKKKDEIRKITEHIEQQGEEGQVKLNKEIEILKTNVITDKARTSTCDSELEKTKTKKEQLNKEIEEIEQKILEIKQEQGSLKKQKLSTEKEQKEIEKKISDFKKKHALDNIGDIEKDIEEADKSSEEKQKQIQELREEQQNLIRETDKLTYQIQGIDDRIQKVIRIEEEHKDQIEELKQKRDAFKKATLELNKRLNDDSEIAAKLNQARQKYQKAQEELSKLQIKKAGMQERISGDIAIKKILENKNKLGGIFGAITELGSVSSKYALALEVSAGAKIKSIVVEDDQIASKCIKFLKENKYGTATFLPLNKIKPAKSEEEVKPLLKMNGVHGMAKDLVSYDPKFKKAFEHVFGNSIVVEDIDTARRVGIGKARMATLDGDLCETSGAMSGGYRAKKESSLSFQEKELVKDLEELEVTVDSEKKTMSQFEEQKEENEKAIAKLRAKKAELEGETIKLERSLHLDSEDLDASKRQKEMINEQMIKTEKRMRELQAKISEVNKELANAKIKKQELRNTISQLRSPVLVAELTTFEQRRTALAEKILQLNAEIKNNETRELNIFAPEKEKAAKLIKQTEKEEAGIKSEKESLKEKIKQNAEVLKEKESHAKKFYEQFKEAFNKRSEISDSIQKDEEGIFLKEDLIRKIEQKINNAAIENAELRAALTSLHEQFEKYSEVPIDETKTESQLKIEIEDFEKMMTDLGMVNLRALEIYDTVQREYESLVEKKNTLKQEKEDVLMMMNEIEAKKKELFMKTFDAINEQFKYIFSKLSTKGDAYLEIEVPEDPFQAGVRIKVKLTGTKFIDVKSLSGGEQTLTSLALIFAIQEHEPASFYVMDEVDAALDKANSKKLAQLLQKYSEKAQYIVISHNDTVITESDTLYGISMNEHGQSTAVSLRV